MKTKLIFILLTLITFNTFPKENPMQTSDQKIRKTLQTYVEGYLNADKKLVAEAFNAETRLYSVDHEAIDKTEMKDWLTNLEERHSRGDIRKAKFDINFIDITGNTAVAKISLQFEKRQFVDYLSLLEVNKHWTIVGKVYSVQESK
ncbi:MAG: nuclear transport factor 2 family protein [Bacteriovoracaceae bacterium]